MSSKLSRPILLADTRLGDPGRVDARISVAPAVMGPGERGRIDLSRVTETVYEVIRGAESFREVVRGTCPSDYVLAPTVVKLADLFDNVVHLRIQARNCQNGSVVYDHEFVGWNFTQSASLGNIAEVLARETPTIRAAIHSDRQRASPATVSDIAITFSHPAEGARSSQDNITVVGLVSTPKGIGRLEVTVNGRPVPISRDVRVQSTAVESQPFTAQITLIPGQNIVTVTAVDRSGKAAQAVRTVFYDVAAATDSPVGVPRLRTGERWVVVIGIDQYKDAAIAPLHYAAADAEAVFRFLTTKAGVKPSNARLLVNQQATQRAIREVLGGFLRQKATRDDEVIIYYAGHGTTEPDQSAEGGVAKYLVPWDADPLNLFASAIPMEEIDRVFGRLAARKILFVQDTCFSGGAGGRTFLAKGLAMRSATLTDRFLQELSQKEGRMILTASDVNQVSQEDPALGHGIFTHYFLEALGGAADLDGDGAVTVREVHLYLQRKVHERSNGVQAPQLYAIGDIVLVQKQR